MAAAMHEVTSWHNEGLVAILFCTDLLVNTTDNVGGHWPASILLASDIGRGFRATLIT